MRYKKPHVWPLSWIIPGEWEKSFLRQASTHFGLFVFSLRQVLIHYRIGLQMSASRDFRAIAEKYGHLKAEYLQRKETSACEPPVSSETVNPNVELTGRAAPHLEEKNHAVPRSG
jgi:hypothetical protein